MAAPRWLWMLAPGLLLAGCAGLMDVLEERGAAGGPGPPIVSDRFLLESESTAVVGELQSLVARDEDTFVDIARAYNLGFDELVQANPGVDPWLPGAGTRILLPTRFVLPDAAREGIVINLASKRLFYYPPPAADGGRAVVTFPIGIGRLGDSTPEGSTTVTSKGRDPVWYVPASIRREYAAAGNPLPPRVPPGPDNPLGRHVLVLGMPSYLIHGTNRPAGVGMRVSHGCVRLFPENIEYLFEEAPVGTPVTIVNQPLLVGVADGVAYLEAHPLLADDNRDAAALLAAELERAAALLASDSAGASLAASGAASIMAAAHGVPTPLNAATVPSQELLLAAARLVHNLAEPPAVPGERIAVATD